MKVYVLTLPQAEERRRGLRDRFPRWYDGFCFVYGITPSELSCSEYHRLVVPQLMREHYLIEPSRVCNVLGHKRVWEEFLSSGEDVALVLEDDVLGDDGRLDLIRSTYPRVLELFGEDLVWHVGVLKNRYISLRETPLYGVYEVPWIARRYVTGAWSYLLTRRSASAMAKMQEDCLDIVDRWHRVIPRETRFLCSDILAHPPDNKSYIRSLSAAVSSYRCKASERVKMVFSLLALLSEGLVCRVFSYVSPLFGYHKFRV